MAGKQFAHLNKGTLFLMMGAEEAEAFAGAYPGLVSILCRHDKPIGARAVLEDLPDALASQLLEATWRSAGGKG
ncbi:hypothetical protein [Pelagibacterium limicola]|uniref:hypothetical protein n=1 Tax=Pelagibacterium limicola TaxID=2791022 RepID=UPI0018AFE2BF|nr:hypothetical protein [Pelagibacterium limicola]